MPDDPTPLHEVLVAQIAQANGRSATLLSDFRAKHRDKPGFHDALICLIGKDTAALADGASWILKAELEDGWQISAAQTADLLSLLPRLTAWPTCLHLLQSVDLLPLSPEDSHYFGAWAKALLQHKRPLIRAWAIHACVRLTPDPSNAASILDAADTDPAASVRARARRLRTEV